MYFKKLYFIGDSHANSFKGIGNVVYLGPVTMWKIAREGIEFNKKGLKFFVFGEIDVRCHLGKGYNIKELVDAYVKRLEKFDNVGIVGITPPTKIKIADRKDFPVVGTDEQRIEWTKELNGELERHCKERGWWFLDVSSYGDMLEKSDGTVHIKDTEGLKNLLWQLGDLVREAILDFRALRYTKFMMTVDIVLVVCSIIYMVI